MSWRLEIEVPLQTDDPQYLRYCFAHQTNAQARKGELPNTQVKFWGSPLWEVKFQIFHKYLVGCLEHFLFFHVYIYIHIIHILGIIIPID